MISPLGAAYAVTKLPAQNLDRARHFYRDRLGLEPVEEREGGLRYVCGTTEFHIFVSSGAASGRSTQLRFEVEDIDQVVADLRTRGLEFETFDLGDLEVTDQIVAVPNNYPSKGSGERGAFFFDSEGHCSRSAKPPDSGQPHLHTTDETGDGACFCALSGMASFENRSLPRAEGAQIRFHACDAADGAIGMATKNNLGTTWR
jgi:catechol 2,3-dioxygenase-like lactoylglutathione lyase family enzyme